MCCPVDDIALDRLRSNDEVEKACAPVCVDEYHTGPWLV